MSELLTLGKQQGPIPSTSSTFDSIIENNDQSDSISMFHKPYIYGENSSIPDKKHLESEPEVFSEPSMLIPLPNAKLPRKLPDTLFFPQMYNTPSIPRAPHLSMMTFRNPYMHIPGTISPPCMVKPEMSLQMESLNNFHVNLPTTPFAWPGPNAGEHDSNTFHSSPREEMVSHQMANFARITPTPYSQNNSQIPQTGFPFDNKMRSFNIPAMPNFNIFCQNFPSLIPPSNMKKLPQTAHNIQPLPLPHAPLLTSLEKVVEERWNIYGAGLEWKVIRNGETSWESIITLQHEPLYHEYIIMKKHKLSKLQGRWDLKELGILEIVGSVGTYASERGTLFDLEEIDLNIFEAQFFFEGALGEITLRLNRLKRTFEGTWTNSACRNPQQFLGQKKQGSVRNKLQEAKNMLEPTRENTNIGTKHTSPYKNVYWMFEHQTFKGCVIKNRIRYGVQHRNVKQCAIKLNIKCLEHGLDPPNTHVGFKLALEPAESNTGSKKRRLQVATTLQAKRQKLSSRTEEVVKFNDNFFLKMPKNEDFLEYKKLFLSKKIALDHVFGLTDRILRGWKIDNRYHRDIILSTIIELRNVSEMLKMSFLKRGIPITEKMHFRKGIVTKWYKNLEHHPRETLGITNNQLS